MSFPCKFFQQGRCNAGRQCKFSHDPSVLKIPVSKPPCRYFLAGHCLAGDRCEFAHVVKKPVKTVVPPPVSASVFCPKPSTGVALPSKAALKSGRQVNPMAETLGDGEDCTYEPETFMIGGEEMNAASNALSTSYAELAKKGLDVDGDSEQFAALQELYMPSTSLSEEELEARQHILQRIRESESRECGICLEPVIAKGNQFGILSGCAHTFCLTCIREWRSVEELQKSVKRSCPLCRCESHIVVPSSYIPADDDEKAKLVEGYKARLGKIPCKHFRQGSGECPFGTSCFYEHRFRDGSLSNPGAPRLRMTEDGEVNAIGKLRLCDVLEIGPRRR